MPITMSALSSTHSIADSTSRLRMSLAISSLWQMKSLVARYSWFGSRKASTRVRTSFESQSRRRDAEGRHARGAAVDHGGHTGVHADPVGLEAEVAEAGGHVGVEVDQTGGDQEAGDVVHREIGVGGDEVLAHRLDAAVTDDDVGDLVGLGGGIDHSTAAEYVIRHV